MREVCQSMSDIAQCMTNMTDCAVPVSVQRSFYRLSMRFLKVLLQFSLINANNSGHHESPQSSSSAMSSLLSATWQAVESTLQGIYTICSIDFSTPSSEFISTADKDLITQTGIDTVIDLLSLTWSSLPRLFERVAIQFKSTQSTTRTSPQEDRETNDLLLLLSSVAFACGAIRFYSQDDLHRKRLIHYALIESLQEGTLILSSNPHILQIYRSKGGLTIRNIAEKLISILIQFMGTFRNFSLDRAGRDQLYEKTTIIASLCQLMKIYNKSAELSLHCTRILAKLSLFDNFRSHLNQDAASIQGLVGVIHTQCSLCSDIMEGNNTHRSSSNNNDNNSDGKEEDYEEDEIEWPAWYTWPLISRLCFTLSNLTTTNATNR